MDMTTYLVGIDGQTIEARSGSLENPSVPLSALTLESWLGVRSSTDAGEHVDHHRALTYSPIWQGVHLISGDVAKLPLHVFRRLPNGGREVDHRHPVDALISLDGLPNDEVDTYTFWRRFMTSALLWENAYAWIDRAGNGEVLGLYNLLPDRTTIERINGDLWYITELSDDTAPGGYRIKALMADEVLHVEGISTDYLGGCDMVLRARQDIGLALAARKFTSKFFSNGGQYGGILQVPPGQTPEAQGRVEQAIQQRHSGTDKAFKTLVLRDGYKWFSTTVDPDKAKLTDLDEQQVRHAARWLNLSPEFLGVKESVSYNSLEARKQGYLDSTLSHWLVAIKAACNHKLRTTSERLNRELFVDYNINALLWADARTRSEIAEKGILSGRFSVNETRAWENMNPRPGGDNYLRPLNSAVDGEDNNASENDD